MLLNVDWHNPRRPNPAPRRTASQAQSLCHLLFSHWRPSCKTYWQLLIGFHNEMGNNGVQFSCISSINQQWQPLSPAARVIKSLSWDFLRRRTAGEVDWARAGWIIIPRPPQLGSSQQWPDTNPHLSPRPAPPPPPGAPLSCSMQPTLSCTAATQSHLIILDAEFVVIH